LLGEIFRTQGLNCSPAGDGLDGLYRVTAAQVLLEEDRELVPVGRGSSNRESIHRMSLFILNRSEGSACGRKKAGSPRGARDDKSKFCPKNVSRIRPRRRSGHSVPNDVGRAWALAQEWPQQSAKTRAGVFRKRPGGETRSRAFLHQVAQRPSLRSSRPAGDRARASGSVSNDPGRQSC